METEGHLCTRAEPQKASGLSLHFSSPHVTGGQGQLGGKGHSEGTGKGGVWGEQRGNQPQNLISFPKPVSGQPFPAKFLPEAN